MKKIAVITTTRAEYGLLSPVVKELRKHESESLTVCLIVSGTHLSQQYGMTVNDIDDRIDQRIVIPVKSDSVTDISENQAKTLELFTGLFDKEKYDAVILLGDRYETLAIAMAAGNTKTPIFHLCGGDTTEGAMDEWIRHSITKISYLHFVTNEDSRKRVIQMGESPERVFNFGSTSVDNIMHMELLSKAEVMSSIGLSDCRYALCTYHPVTLDNGNLERQIEDFVGAIKKYPSIRFIITKSNADMGGDRINKLLDMAEKEVENISVYTSLGTVRYLSLMKFAEFVLGNSSSGIIETPIFGVPTVNIGDRQRGRMRTESIIDCGTSQKEICSAIDRALSTDCKDTCCRIVSPYGIGNSAVKISDKAIETVMNGNIDLKKQFYCLSF